MSPLELALFGLLLMLTASAAIGVRVAYSKGMHDGLADAMERHRLMIIVVKRLAYHGLPESDLDEESPGDSVVLKYSHLDHEYHRETVRLAQAAIGLVNAE